MVNLLGCFFFVLPQGHLAGRHPVVFVSVFSGNRLASGKPSETLKSWSDAEGMSTLESMNDSLWRSLLDEEIRCLGMDWGWCVCFFWGGLDEFIGLGIFVCVSSVFDVFFLISWGYLRIFVACVRWLIFTRLLP